MKNAEETETSNDEQDITSPSSPFSNESSSSSVSVLIITAGYDHTIRFWDVLIGTCIATLQHNESVKLSYNI